VEKEPVPLRTYSMTERMNADPVAEIPFTGNKGIMLGDVYDGKATLEDFVAQLTDEEMCYMVRGEGMCSPKVTPGIAAAFGGVTDELKAYGIPCAGCSDGPSGIRMDCGTKAFAMPNGTCLACTFDLALCEELYQWEGKELRKNRIDTLLGPGMNLHRNPLNGRNFEYFSEDPLLTGKMAAAQLKGMAAYGVTGTIKHFAANNQEHHRRNFNSIISERAVREMYLRGFEIAVKEGDAYSIMSTYGAINGLWTAGNYDLITTILRGEWNYDGLVMTDWWAFMNDEGGEATVQNTAAMVKAQNDLYMVTADSKTNANDDNLAERLASGMLERRHLQRCAKNILKVLMKSPVMERSLGRMSQEEKEAFEQMDASDKVDFDIIFHEFEDGKMALDTTVANTDKGNSLLYGIKCDQKGVYTIRMKVKVEASELAQVNTSIFINEHLINMITMNGTGDEWQIKECDIMLFGPNNYLKFFFAESGTRLDGITLEYKEELQPFF
ncbi:MAG: beta-glucosidase, partial [Clostridiales bacterium]|nr:beta-glucosidase [Candidatus Blautia equi]